MNDHDLEKLAISERHCRFPHEVPEKMLAYNYYSHSTCIVQCKIDGHLSICNCTHHLMPKTCKFLIIIFYIIIKLLHPREQSTFSQETYFLCILTEACLNNLDHDEYCNIEMVDILISKIVAYNNVKI